jgi:hypothetical protein
MTSMEEKSLEQMQMVIPLIINIMLEINQLKSPTQIVLKSIIATTLMVILKTIQIRMETLSHMSMILLEE